MSERDRDRQEQRAATKQIQAMGYEVFEVGLFNRIATANKPIVYREHGKAYRARPLGPGPVRSRSALVRIGIPVPIRRALGAIELADRVGAYFRDSLANPVTLELPRAHCTLHHDVRTLRQRPSVLGEFAEGNDPVPVGPALPFAFSVLPGFFSRDRKTATTVPF